MTQQPDHVEDHWTAETSGPAAPVPLSAQRRSGSPPAEQHERGQRGQDGGSWAAPVTFERVPPQDLDAEQSVLGGMLLSKDAIADVVEVLKGHDFYRPAHQTVYQAILDLYAKGEPADPITIAAELTKRGDIGRVGGPGYLHSLVQSVPTAANAEYYAEIVHEQAVLRRLVEAGTRITQMGYAADGDVDEIVNSAQAEIYAVTEEQTSEDYLPLADIMEGALDEIEAIGSRSGQMTGVPTGFADLDSLTNGLHPGQMVVVAARPAMGKALALDTPLPTPRGWTSMGEVAVGDLLMGPDGRATRVTAATGVMTERPCFEVGFDDGTVVTADAEHQWLTVTGVTDPPAARNSAVRTTREIAESLHGPGPGRKRRHWVRNAQPLVPAQHPVPVPVPPYVLGVWLAAGPVTAAGISGMDRRVVVHIEDEGVNALETSPGVYELEPSVAPPHCGHCTERHAVLREQLACLGVLEEPRIPSAYLRASVEQRRSLLAGLLDVAGTVGDAGGVSLAVGSRRLVQDVSELIVGLGYRCETPASDGEVPASHGAAEVRRGGSYELVFRTVEDVFRLEHLRLEHKEGVREHAPGPAGRYVTGARPVPSVPVRCVQVDNAEHMYLAGMSMIPTHNSTLALDFARACSIKSNLPSVIFSLEMGRNEIAMRLLSAEARVALQHMRSGSMTDEDWTRLARQMAGVTDAPLYIDDSPNLSMMEIRAKCRRLKQRNDLHLIVIDYLQLMQTGGSRRPESRQQEVSEMSRNLKLLAKELEVPVVALSQLNRGPEQRTDKKPQVSDLRESGCMTADTTLLRADTGASVSFADLMANGHEGVLVWSLDENRRLTPAPITNVFFSGVKPVYRLRLASGREVKATASHPFLTFGGWTPLGDLAVGRRVAVPRITREPVGTDVSHGPGTGAFRRRQVTVRGHRGESVAQVRAEVDGRAVNTGVDFPHAEAGDLGRARRVRVSRTPRRFQGATSTSCFGTTTYDGCPRFTVDSGYDDVFWDRVVEIAPLGEQPVYDATVRGTHNFIAEGIAAHNSIEQDADMVILLHREDAYEKESPRAGEADLIVAKHRNGPTSTITVAFQGHFSRFQDMANGM